MFSVELLTTAVAKRTLWFVLITFSETPPPGRGSWEVGELGLWAQHQGDYLDKGVVDLHSKPCRHRGSLLTSQCRRVETTPRRRVPLRGGTVAVVSGCHNQDVPSGSMGARVIDSSLFPALLPLTHVSER